MQGGRYFDLVMGIDIHYELVPSPGGPVPTPLPNLFLGLVFDPFGLAFGLLLQRIETFVRDQPTRGIVLTHKLPATCTGDEAVALVPHMVLPPGTGWVVPPEDNAILLEGAKTVTVTGSAAARAGVSLMSCGEPMRMSTSTLISIPAGPPVLIGGPTEVSLLDAALGAIRARFASEAMHRLVSRLGSRRTRNLLRRAVCFFTGHPVDVATGRLMSWHTDLELPGPLPLTMERIYNSGFADRDGPLGHGWSHSLDQRIWREEGCVVFLDEEGRELVFDTLDLPGEGLAEGESLWHPIHRLTLKNTGTGSWEIKDPSGQVRCFAPAEGGDPAIARLMEIRSCDGEHRISLAYSTQGRLSFITDSAGRTVELRNDERGRLTAIHLPNPDGQGSFPFLRYEYDEAGNLVRIKDALAHSQPWRFEYEGHLLVAETDRANLTFYFQYDGTGEDAWCTRTWGHGGIYDHELSYDKVGGVTVVTNSHGHKSLYRSNLANLVTEVQDAHGRSRHFEYDDETLLRTAEIDALGHRTSYAFDDRGRCTRIEEPTGAITELIYAEHEAPVEVIDPRGGSWRFELDLFGRVKERTDPLARSTLYRYREGLLRRIEAPEGTTELIYDRNKNLRAVRDELGEHRFSYDALGRVIELRDPEGAVEERRYDSLGRVTFVREPDGNERFFEHDSEGNLLSASDKARAIDFEHEGYHQLAARIEAGAAYRLHLDPEDELVGIENELGERHRFLRDARGHIEIERGFDGGYLRRYVRDAEGRVTKVYHALEKDEELDLLHAELAYDEAGRLLKVRYRGGDFERYTYNATGDLIEAENQDTRVVFKRDPVGRIVREELHPADGYDAGWVESRFASSGDRIALVSSGGCYQQIHRGPRGQVETLQVGDAFTPWTFRFRRDALGRELERHLPTGQRLLREHDRAGQPTRQLLGHDIESPLSESLYEWGWGETLQRKILRGHGAPEEETPFEYEHDERGRLVAVRFPREEGDGQMTRWRAMDPAGNLHRRSDLSDHRYGPGGQLRSAYGNEYEHDLQGRMTEKRHPDGSRTRYTWRADGHLGEIALPDGSRLCFAYDPLGRRIRKEHHPVEGEPAVTRWIWDGDVPIHEHVDGQEPITWIFAPESFTPIGKIQGEQRQAFATDYLGVPTEGCDEHGLLWRMQLDPWGTAEINGRKRDCPFRWPGQVEDYESGLYYNRHRYYDPELGIYLSPDPIGFAGSEHLYAYPEDPLVSTDPLGLAKCGRSPGVAFRSTGVDDGE